MPLATISIIIPAYNAQQFLRETIESALLQTRPAHEIIVIDDGSTDATKEIALTFGPAVRYIYQENQGLSGARNTGIAHATGDWIALLDADDLMLPDKLALQASVIEANSGLDVVYSAFTYLYPDGSTKLVSAFPCEELWPALRYRQPILPSTAIVRRSALLGVGGFTKSTRRYFPEDWDLWFRIIQRYTLAAFQEVPESLTLYRQSDQQLSKNFMPMSDAIIEMLDTQLLNDLRGFIKSAWKRRIESRIYYRIALALREANDYRYWSFAISSFLLWPFCGSVVPRERYRVLAHMTVAHLRKPQLNVRYWWPKRTCREYLATGVPRNL